MQTLFVGVAAASAAGVASGGLSSLGAINCFALSQTLGGGVAGTSGAGVSGAGADGHGCAGLFSHNVKLSGMSSAGVVTGGASLTAVQAVNNGKARIRHHDIFFIVNIPYKVKGS